MIELSADLGEGSPGEEEIWPLIDAANVACGGHAGNEESMRAAVAAAQQFGVVLGAHPSYPDRQHFGRRSLALPLDVLRDSIVQQLQALLDVAKRAGSDVRRVKPHGALYNDAHVTARVAEVIVDGMRTVDPTLAMVCPADSQMAIAARAAGVSVMREAFADRRYEPDGSLTSRSVPGALLDIDEAVAQAELLVRESVVISRGGLRVPILFDTLCIHADMPRAVERLRAIRAALV